VTKPKLATIGYGMHTKKPTRPRAEILRGCLEEHNVSLLIDTRESPWGGFWNPKKLQAIFEDSPTTYLFKEETYAWHKVFGAPKAIRTIATTSFDMFAEAYTQTLFEKDNTCLDRLFSRMGEEELTAIMCCEPYVETRDNCHRFIIASLMVEHGYLEEDDIIHLDLDEYDTQ
tara:strand:- start:947 stop:1462 length:516 start_codon:yes stop_codon:yes gene_type:complete